MRKILLSLAVSGVLAFASERALIADDYSNYFSTAKEIPLNMEISGSIETAGDIDIFKFTLDKDDGVSVSASSEGYAVDIYVIKKETIETLSEYLNEENWDIRGDVKNGIKNILNFYATKEKSSSLNINSGIYYLVTLCNSNSATNSYTFKIESELNEGNVSLDKVTLEYCKNNPSECGIEVETKKTNYNFTNGWNLAGASETIDTSTLNGDVWAYRGGKWEHNPSKIEELEGFWIKK